MRVGIVSDIHCNARGLVPGPCDNGRYRRADLPWRQYLRISFLERSRRAIAAARRAGDCRQPRGILFRPARRARPGPRRHRPGAGRLARRAAAPARAEIGGKRLLLVHSTPWEPRGAYVHPGSTLLAGFGEADADFVLYGHTHQQLVERIGRVLVINPGSAGDARDPRNGGNAELRRSRHGRARR